jgi:hypothetical protein
LRRIIQQFAVVQQFVKRFVQVLHEVIDDDHQVGACYGDDDL